MKVGLDKWLHATACFVVAMLVGLVMLSQGCGYAWSSLMGALVALLVGVAKEAWDALRKGGTGWSWADMAADAVGALIGVVGILLT